MPNGMIHKLKFGILGMAFVVLSACNEAPPQPISPSKLAPPVNLVVGEGFTNPLGYYESAPRFSWQISPSSTAKRQTAYQLQVASSIDLLNTQADLWDSKKIPSK